MEINDRIGGCTVSVVTERTYEIEFDEPMDDSEGFVQSELDEIGEELEGKILDGGE